MRSHISAERISHAHQVRPKNEIAFLLQPEHPDHLHGDTFSI
eukprot:SAG31_NODE_39949_length_284_cov_0.843243_1_plen_41_part_10